MRASRAREGRGDNFCHLSFLSSSTGWKGGKKVFATFATLLARKVAKPEGGKNSLATFRARPARRSLKVAKTIPCTFARARLA